MCFKPRFSFHIADEVSDKGKDKEKDDEEKKPVCFPPGIEPTPARTCRSTFNTTAPLYGVSLTSGVEVTIVQIFPDLLQQVVYETCE